jgi:tetratricopeptide (TPR) repeat protein
MTDSLTLSYLMILIVLLGGSSWLVLRQVLRTRRTELTLTQLQRKVGEGKGSPEDHYELGSILLDKKLFSQAILQFQKALKSKQLDSGSELAALLHNALGYAYAAQEQYDLAIRQYREALKVVPGYVIALKNLAFAYERKQLTAEAMETYETVLSLDAKNAVAQKRLDILKKTNVSSL